jgi:hypothetical protein
MLSRAIMRLFFLPVLILMVAFSFAYEQEKKDPIEARLDSAMRLTPQPLECWMPSWSQVGSGMSA